MKLFHKIHLWLSVPFGIIVTLTCFSGAMLVFQQEITRAVRSDVYYVAEVKPAALPMEQLLATVGATLPDSVSIRGVEVSPDPERTYQVNLSKPRRAAVFIDQYTGQITGRSERLAFFSTMYKLHTRLLAAMNPGGDGATWGKLAVGCSTLAFAVVLVSGIVMWWPRARKSLRRSLTVPFSHGHTAFWAGLHTAGGMYVALCLLAMALTGLTWSFDWYRSAFYAVCGAEAGELRGVIASIHTGAFGGMATRILWFIAALLGAILPLTGYYLWFRRLRAK